MRRALVGALAFACCLPLLLASGLISGSTGNPLPSLLALAEVGLLVAAFAWRRGRLPSALAAAALFVVLVSPVVDATRVDSPEETRNAPFGLPFPYVEADLSYTPPTYPQTFSWDPWEHPAELDVLLFLASYGVVLLGTAVLLLLLLTRKTRFAQLT